MYLWPERLLLKVFRASLPCGFYQPISSGVTTAAKKVKKLKSADGNRETKDIGAIFNRLLLMSSVSDTPIDMQEVLKYELTRCLCPCSRRTAVRGFAKQNLTS